MARRDEENPVKLTETVAEFKLINPHSRIRVDVKDDRAMW